MNEKQDKPIFVINFRDGGGLLTAHQTKVTKAQNVGFFVCVHVTKFD